jgi:dihydroorotate dehydrogenase
MIVKNIVQDKLPIIASGGVMSASDHKEKIDAGADLVQIYTGFIFEGPELVLELVNL